MPKRKSESTGGVGKQMRTGTATRTTSTRTATAVRHPENPLLRRRIRAIRRTMIMKKVMALKLERAITYGKKEEVKKILENRFTDVNYQCGNETPLSLAARIPNQNILNILLGHRNIEINKIITIRDDSDPLQTILRDGGTALHSAIEAGNPRTVQLLLKHHAKIHIRNQRGETAFRLANRLMEEGSSKRVIIANILRREEERERQKARVRATIKALLRYPHDSPQLRTGHNTGALDGIARLAIQPRNP